MQTLSARLRAHTKDLHARVEHATNLPDSIHTMADYARCLRGFYRVRAPIERRLAAFVEWQALGIDLPGHLRAACLRADLAALRLTAPALAEPTELPDFCAALGALYVLEGSALGGKLILRALQTRFGAGLEGAVSYFAATSPMPWPAFKAVLDAFGALQPAAQPRVLAGARATFLAFETGLTAPPHDSGTTDQTAADLA